MISPRTIEIFQRSTRRCKPLLWGVGLAFTLGLNPTFAQERWFQVEVIAFARQANDQQEYWPGDIKLAYPLNWVELRDPSVVTASTSNTGDSNTREPGDTLAHEDYSNLPPDLDRSPFYQLPKAEQKLSRHASALTRDSRFRVLFHQAWRQPVTSLRSAPAILINGGNNYGNHTELEGSITLSLAQLLQINTRLWLTEFEINYGQTPGDWPPLPVHPQQLKAAVLESVRSAENITILPEQPGSWSLQSIPPTDIASEASAPYLPKRIVLMEDERRMRSNEIHYIDHPLFGLIIQLTPYELPANR